MDDIKTLTVDELIAHLTQFPHNTKVFISKDSEGNSFGSLSAGGLGSEHHKEDTAIVFYPLHEGLYFSDIFPKTWNKELQDG